MSPKESIKNDRVVGLIKHGVDTLGVRGLARAVGISPAIITRYMKGKVGEPSQSTLQKLAVYGGVSVAWLRGDGPELSEGTFEIVSNSFINLDLPGYFASNVGTLLVGDWIESFQRLTNNEDLTTVLKEYTLKVFSIINVLAPYYKHKGATGDNPYAKAPYTDSEYILDKQLKGMMEQNILRKYGVKPPED